MRLGKADEIVIRPLRNKPFSDFVETYRYRGLVASMVLRQFKLQFAGSFLGALWIIARPLTMLGLFTAFRHLSNAQVGVTLPYPVFLYSGLILWFFFLAGVEASSGALERDSGLIRKVYFPRLVSPLSSVLSETLSFVIAALPLAVIMVSFGLAPGWAILALPALLLQMILLMVGLGAVFSVLSLQGGDWRRGLGLVLYAGLFLSPVIYAPDMLPGAARHYYQFNPLVGPLMAFRAMLVDGVTFPVWEWVYSWVFSIVMFVVGMSAFHRFERDMLDRL